MKKSFRRKAFFCVLEMFTKRWYYIKGTAYFPTKKDVKTKKKRVFATIIKKSGKNFIKSETIPQKNCI